MTDAHEMKYTFTVDVNVPQHADRIATPLFEKTRKELLEKEGGRCWICQRTAEESGHPLEAHHLGIERCFAEAPIDWDLVKVDYPNFDWSTFDESNPYLFVDNCLAQARILCKDHHTSKEMGIHNLPFSVWVMQRYLKDGYKFNDLEIIHHEQV